MEKDLSFLKLSHQLNGRCIMVRTDKVVLVEDMGGDTRLVSLEGGDSVLCSESMEYIMSSLNA